LSPPPPTITNFASFIFDTAFKIILSKISEMPRSNFLFIDEGLSVFDKENLTKLHPYWGEHDKYENLFI
jgi:hypothetical protein